jgi:hypothetical protein
MLARLLVYPVIEAALCAWLFPITVLAAVLDAGLPTMLANPTDRHVLITTLTATAVPAAVLVATAVTLPSMPPARFGLVLIAKITSTLLVSAAVASFALFGFFAVLVGPQLLALAAVAAVGTYLLRRGWVAGILLTLATNGICLAACQLVAQRRGAAAPAADTAALLFLAVMLGAFTLAVAALLDLLSRSASPPSTDH